MATLSDIILSENVQAVAQYLRSGVEVNYIDEYGFTPLIEAAIVDSLEISNILLQHGADPNQQDVTGGTALHWAAENHNLALCQLLFQHRADPNAYTLAGQPALTMPILRQQNDLKQLFLSAGADLQFAQDYINTKMIGHIYELVGTTAIVSPANEFVDVDFEGFYLEVTLGLVADALNQFQNHFAARQLRRFQMISRSIVEIILRAAKLIKFQQYRVDAKKHNKEIEALLSIDPIVIPVGYEGHAITFIKYHDIWVKCDRREDSRMYDNVMFYKVSRQENMTHDFIKHLIYEKQSDQFINVEIDQLLGLTPMTELKVEAQISGNCSWANVEACVPALFLLILEANGSDQPLSYYKTLALNYFHRWREWNKDRMLTFSLQALQNGDALRKATVAEILATILFQRCDYQQTVERERFERILKALTHSPYQYVLKNYLRIYYYQGYTEEGKRFFHYLKQYKLFNL